MKPAPAEALPATGTRTVITKTPIPLERERTTPEFWEYIEKLQPQDWEEHSCYLYRTDPRSTTYGGEGSQALEKIVGTLEVRPGVSIPFNNREDVELAIREKHGGRAFRLILKKRSERITEGKIINDAPARYPDNNRYNHGPTVTPVSESSATADVAKMAMSTVAGQERQATEVAISALKGAADVVNRFANSPERQPSETDQLFRQVMIAMLQRALNPPDPIELFTKMIALMPRNGGGGGGGDGNHPAIDRLMDVALERILNPQPAGPATSASAELVRQLPSVAGYVTQAMAEWRHGVEAQRDTAALMRGAVPPGTVPAPATNQPAARTLPAPAPPQTIPPEGAAQVLDIEFLESKIVEILRKPDLSAEEAADDCLSFLDLINPMLVKQLAGLGEPGLVNLFQTRPILRQVTQNMPRVIEFIKAFIKFATPTAPPAMPTPAAPNGGAKA